MQKKKMVNIDGNTATAQVAYAFSEVAAIYPITPSSDMGEKADSFAAAGRKNIFGETVDVVQMQSEAGAAGACHGSLAAGALTTTFTASQGLLLMIPNMYKIAGEMIPTVFHVSARSIAAQALSIFGDHSDVMGTRQTGFAMLSSTNVQEAQDMAAIAHLATLEARVPFLHFFDGFRTSHSISKIEEVDYDTLKSMINMDALARFRAECLSPERPMSQVGAQNPDVYFQGRETVNKYYENCPEIVRKYMKLYAEKTGRSYDLFEYWGDPEAERIIILMGSGAQTADETLKYLNKQGEKVGILVVRLYRPFSVKDFVEKIPASVKKIAVLDRTKEPGAPGEPLYLDTVAALKGRDVEIIGGRYGLSSKEFTPAMVKAVFDHLEKGGHHDFTVGINDDVTHKSIEVGPALPTEQKGIKRCKFWGYGSDGTVSANKNSIKIIGESTDMYVQGYFSYDSNKSGGFTVSHLRFGKEPIQSEYLLTESDFIALHYPNYIGKYDILEGIIEGGTFLINCSWKPEKVFEHLTEDMQKTIIEKKIKVYCVDAGKIAKKVGLGNRINTVMQTAFFKLSGVLPEEEAIALSKKYVEKQFKAKGMEIVEMNWTAIDAACDAVEEVIIPEEITKSAKILDVVPPDANAFAKEIVDPVLRMKGDSIPVSKMSIDGKIPTNTKRLEKKGRPGNPPTFLAKMAPLDNTQYSETYFEYPGCCTGCGEVGYISLVTQLFGDRMMIANATGCSSIYGGTFPTVPYAVDSNGRGPAWGNSLFEDNAEYGLGYRLATDANRKHLKSLLKKIANLEVSEDLKKTVAAQLELFDSVSNEAKGNRDKLLDLLPAAIEGASGETLKTLKIINELKDFIIQRSIWCFGGDGWAYDIGFGGLDHVMASNKNVNILVIDTEVYSNTGGQSSKATPRGAVAKFAAMGKQTGKKNLGLMMTSYGSCFVASCNMVADREQTINAMIEAEKFDGPSIIICYAPCIAHGYNLPALARKQSLKAKETGYWPIYEFNPAKGDEAMNWQTPEATSDFREFTSEENRYKILSRFMPEEAERLLELAKKDNARRFEALKSLAKK